MITSSSRNPVDHAHPISNRQQHIGCVSPVPIHHKNWIYLQYLLLYQSRKTYNILIQPTKERVDISYGYHSFPFTFKRGFITRNHMQRRLYHITVLSPKNPLEKHLFGYINPFDDSSPKSPDTSK